MLEYKNFKGEKSHIVIFLANNPLRESVTYQMTTLLWKWNILNREKSHIVIFFTNCPIRWVIYFLNSPLLSPGSPFFLVTGTALFLFR